MTKARELANLGNAYSYGALSNRNLIINGAMQVAQRGTSSSSGAYSTVDRYFHNLSGGTSTVTREEATLGQEVDGQFEYWLKVNTTTGNNYCGIQQRVENVRSLRQGKATLSFWVKGTNPASGQYLVNLQRLPAGTSGSTLDIPLNDTYTVSSTWTRKTFTFDVPALGTSVTENGNSQLYITLGAQEGSDTSTDAWELNITGVQLEVGDTATPFEHRSYGDELARCQRYYYQRDWTGYYEPIFMPTWCNSTNSQEIMFYHPVEMRANPSCSHNGVGNFRLNNSTGQDETCNGITFSNQRTHSTLVSFSKATANFTIGDSGYVNTQAHNDASFYIDAEL